MTPLLEAHGGRFVVDVRVAEVLRSPEPGAAGFNRLFTLRFRSQRDHDAFFADPEYLAIRARLFEPSVSGGAHVLGRHEVVAA